MADIEATSSSTDVVAEEMDPGPTSESSVSQDAPAPDTNSALDHDGASGDDLDAMEVQPDIADDGSDDMLLAEAEHGMGKRVKVRISPR